MGKWAARTEATKEETRRRRGARREGEEAVREEVGRRGARREGEEAVRESERGGGEERERTVRDEGGGNCGQ